VGKVSYQFWRSGENACQPKTTDLAFIIVRDHDSNGKRTIRWRRNLYSSE